MTDISKHTPGPWSFDGPAHNIHVREAARPEMRICFMTSDGPARANARLIAAAPDMLAALRDMRHHFGNPKRDEWLSDAAFGEALRADARARDAIAKAEGR
jgi:hypothetical protein